MTGHIISASPDTSAALRAIGVRQRSEHFAVIVQTVALLGLQVGAIMALVLG